jgi:hypothetical protein
MTNLSAAEATRDEHGRFLPESTAAQLKGQTFGHLFVLGRAGTAPGLRSRNGQLNVNAHTVWEVECRRPIPGGGICGRRKFVRGSAMVHGQMKSCGCARLARLGDRTPRHNPASMQDQTFGLLTCRRLLPSINANSGKRWLCECACQPDNPVVVEVRAKDLRSKNTKSCGCLARRKPRKRERQEVGSPGVPSA